MASAVFMPVISTSVNCSLSVVTCNNLFALVLNEPVLALNPLPPSTTGLIPSSGLDIRILGFGCGNRLDSWVGGLDWVGGDGNACLDNLDGEGGGTFACECWPCPERDECLVSCGLCGIWGASGGVVNARLAVWFWLCRSGWGGGSGGVDWWGVGIFGNPLYSPSWLVRPVPVAVGDDWVRLGEFDCPWVWIGDPSSSELSGLATYKPAATPLFLAPSGRRPIEPIWDEGPAWLCEGDGAVDTDNRGMAPFPWDDGLEFTIVRVLE